MPFALTGFVHPEPINDPHPTRSKAHRWAMSLFWIDILLTLVVLAAVASRF
jgi:hypothetical protein